MIGKFIELVFLQSKSNFIFGILIFLGLSSCLASKSLISSVKEISNLINDNIIDHKTEQIVKEKVQRIVSRDVSKASLEHLLRSSSESLTENSVDGVFGPLFWIFIGTVFIKFSIFLPGPLSLGFSYKAISTLDSMIGYKYDQYKYLGFFSAKIEDYSTFLPSRLVLLTLPLVSSEIKKSGKLPKFDFEPKSHFDLGEALGLFDFQKGAKLSGSGFPLYMDKGATLERYLINAMIEHHIQEFSFKEVFPSVLKNKESINTKGQQQKIEHEMNNTEVDN